MVSLRSLLCLFVVFLSSFALSRSGGNYTFVALLLYIFALGISIWILLPKASSVALPLISFNWSKILLFFLLLTHLFWIQKQYTHFGINSSSHQWMGYLSNILTSITALLLLLEFTSKKFIKKILEHRIQVILWSISWICLVGIFLLVPFTSPDPKIDVFTLQQEAPVALVDGKNPYAIEYTNLYGTGTSLYPDGRARYYAYPPLSFLFGLTSLVTGDVRWIYIFCHLLAGFFLFLLGRQLNLKWSESLALSFLFLSIPNSPTVLEKSWTEPSIVVSIAIASWLSTRGNSKMSALFSGIAVSLKQYMIIWIPLLMKTYSKKELLIIGSVFLISYGSFFIWDPQAMIEDLIHLHLGSPFRVDGLTFSSFIYRITGQPLNQYWTIAVMILAILFLVFHRPKFVSKSDENHYPFYSWFSLGFFFLMVFLFSKQAFGNYFYFAHFLLALSLIWSRGLDLRLNPPRSSTDSPD